MSMIEFIDFFKVYIKDKMLVNYDYILIKKEILRWFYLLYVIFIDVNVEIGFFLGSNVLDVFVLYDVVIGFSGFFYVIKMWLGWIVWNVFRDGEIRICDVNRVIIEQYCECDMKLEELVKVLINFDFLECVIEDKREYLVEDKKFLSQVEGYIS